MLRLSDTAKSIDRIARRKLASGTPSVTARMLLQATTRVARVLYASPISPQADSPNTIISRALKSGSVFVDGGANIGQMSRIASVAVEPDGEVHAFEPNPAIFAELSQTMRGAGFKNVRCNRLALSSKSGSMTLYLAANRVSSSLSRGHLSGAKLEIAGATEVEVVTLDSYRVSMDRAIDLMKLDLEGHELYALQGASRVLAKDRPLIICETAPSAPVADLMLLLEGFGYWASTLDGHRLGSAADFRPGRDHDLLFGHPSSRLSDARR